MHCVQMSKAPILSVSIWSASILDTYYNNIYLKELKKDWKKKQKQQNRMITFEDQLKFITFFLKYT